jgi:uncharacterized OsmC-like protein
MMDGYATTTAPKVVNGVNVDGLFALIEGIRRDPAKGATRWHVATSWQGQTRSRSQVEGFGIGSEEVERRFTIDIDEPRELGGSNRFANPQEYLIAALNACVTVGYVAQCAVRGIVLESLVIETEGEIDLRGFLGIDPAVPNGYESLRYTVRIKGNGTKEQFAEIHKAVMATSPNFYNLSRPVALKPTLVVE